MTKLVFRYTGFYDEMLARLAGQEFRASHAREGRTFQRRITNHWKKYNDRIFRYYARLGFVLPSFWLAYPVHPWRRLIPFDDPLTFFITKDLDASVATIVHELCHVFFGYVENREIGGRLWRHITHAFPKEDLATQKHLGVIPLARGGLLRIFDQRKAALLLEREEKYEGLERAWRILNIQPRPLDENPLRVIQLLQPLR